MGFRKDFLWGGATAANQCEGGANEGNRGVANVDLMPLGEDRYLVGTGKMKMYDFDDQHFYPALTAVDFYHHYKEDIALFVHLLFLHHHSLISTFNHLLTDSKRRYCFIW